MLIFLLDPQLKSIFTNTEHRPYKYAPNMTVRSDHCRLIDQEERTSQLKDLLEFIFCLVLLTFVFVWLLGAPVKMCRNTAFPCDVHDFVFGICVS